MALGAAFVGGTRRALIAVIRHAAVAHCDGRTVVHLERMCWGMFVCGGATRVRLGPGTRFEFPQPGAIASLGRLGQPRVRSRSTVRAVGRVLSASGR